MVLLDRNTVTGNSARCVPYGYFVSRLECLHSHFFSTMPLGEPPSSQLDSRNEISKHREDRERGTLDMASGPSNVSAAAPKLKRRSKGTGPGPATLVTPGEQKSPVAFEEPSFENNGDFIAFRLGDGPEVHDPLRKESEQEPRERDWNKGKGKAHESDTVAGRKRKADLDRSDGYNNKKERLDAASRKAPWVMDVDWEGSANVAELFVFSLALLSGD